MATDKRQNIDNLKYHSFNLYENTTQICNVLSGQLRTLSGNNNLNIWKMGN